MSLDRPVFILGPHRSGTTVLYRVLGRQDDIGYLNRYDRRWPARIATLMGRWGDDLPHEAQRFWDRARVGDDDVLLAEHAAPAVRDRFTRRIEATLRTRDRTRFLCKYPRLSLRVGWLDAMFPDAYVVHLIRDWRAVVNSTAVRHHKREGREVDWFGVRMEGWRELRGAPVEEIATRQYIACTRALETAAAALGERYVPVRYHELCAEPENQVRRILERVELAWCNRVRLALERAGLKSRNQRWRETLGETRADELREIAPDLLARYEQDAPPASA